MLDIEDPSQLQAYLVERGWLDGSVSFEARPLSGGVSNKVMRVSGTRAGVLVIKQALEKLRVKEDWFSSPARIHREALGLRWLERLEPAGSTPAFIFEDHEQQLFAMAAVPEPHENLKSLLLKGLVPFDLISQMGELLAGLHGLNDDGQEWAEEVFEDRSFFENLRLEPYYLRSAEREPAAAEFLHALVSATRERRLALTHGDFSPKNFLVLENRLCLLDHEVIHFGDPAFDLGFMLTHFLSKAHHLPGKREDLVRASLLFLNSYRRVSRRNGCEMFVVRHTLGCLLARVAGRSPLEYLDDIEKSRQRDVVLRLMANPPAMAEELINIFIHEIS